MLRAVAPRLPDDFKDGQAHQKVLIFDEFEDKCDKSRDPHPVVAGVTDSFPGKVYSGWIGFISPVAEFTPKQVQTTELRTKLVYQARVYVCNPDNELRLGMPVSVDVPLSEGGAEGGALPGPPCRKD